MHPNTMAQFKKTLSKAKLQECGWSMPRALLLQGTSTSKCSKVRANAAKPHTSNVRCQEEKHLVMDMQWCWLSAVSAPSFRHAELRRNQSSGSGHQQGAAPSITEPHHEREAEAMLPERRELVHIFGWCRMCSSSYSI